MPNRTLSRGPSSQSSRSEGLLERPVQRLKPEGFRHIRLQADSPVARITLNHPEHNLLNEQMLRELTAAVELLSEREEVKAILLDAAGKIFCGGMDVAEYTADRAFQMIDSFQTACLAMMDAVQPIVVVVNGPAIGGGAELAAFGDLVVATPRARFALPEITIGMFPPLASTMFPHLIGPKLALELVLTGEAITGERARDLGLVNRLVTEAQLEQTISDLVARITAQSGAVMGMAKKAVVGSMAPALREAMKFSMDVFLNELYRLEDSREGLRALMEKRKPQWKNR